MMGRIKLFAINYLTRNLLKTIVVEDLFRKEGQSWYIGRRKLSPAEVEDLKEEADSLLESQIWKLMSTEIGWHSNLTMFEKARTSDDLLFGKAMLKCWDLAGEFLANVRKL